MLKGLKLTERDHVVLKAVYENSFLSFRQIWHWYFKGRSKSTAYNRISSLCREGYLTSLKAGFVVHHGDKKEVGIVYSSTKKAIDALKVYYSSQYFHRDSPVPVNTSSLYHDYLLSEVLWRLKENVSDAVICNSKILSEGSEGGKKQPDAIIKYEGEVLALELELTPKSERRYRDIVLGYRLSDQFGKVLYLCGSKTLEEKIKAHIIGKKVEGLSSEPTDKFYFLGLKAFLEAPQIVGFSNGKNLWPEAKDNNFNEKEKEYEI